MTLASVKLEIDEGRLTETQQRILAAAAHCFTRYGFQRARVEDVANEAGVSRALVYSYFSSKKGLLLAVHQQFRQSWITLLESIVDEAVSASDALTAWLNISAMDVAKNSPVHSNYVASNGTIPVQWQELVEAAIKVGGRQLIENSRRESLALFAQLLHQGINSGEFRDDIDVEATALVIHTLQVKMLRNTIEGNLEDITVERCVDAAVTVLLSGLRKT